MTRSGNQVRVLGPAYAQRGSSTGRSDRRRRPGPGLLRQLRSAAPALGLAQHAAVTANSWSLATSGTCGWWSAQELFGDDPLLQRVVGVEQQLHGGRGVLPDGARPAVEQLL